MLHLIIFLRVSLIFSNQIFKMDKKLKNVKEIIIQITRLEWNAMSTFIRERQSLRTTDKKRKTFLTGFHDFLSTKLQVQYGNITF